MTDNSGSSPPELTPALWRRITAALDTVLDLEGDERQRHLDQLRKQDRALCSHVEALLTADSCAEGFLGEAAGDAAASILWNLEGSDDLPRDDLPPGTDIPPYRLERQIGQGGMGSVYLANRIDGQFEQRIALKVIKRGMDTDEITRRFLAERQILARLEHANIARLLDGGVTPDGRPYFAMEYVEGLPITTYADERRLTIEERVSVFVEVCAAVRYAQQHLIVHRDLKPSNVLVTNAGVVKLLDFGVAKLLGAPDDPEHPATQTGVRVMTPEYAAPEQLLGQTVTTATDVYALGVLLYEILSGRRPHDRPHSTPRDLEQTILTRDPRSLAKTVLEDIEFRQKDGTWNRREAAVVAEARRASPRSLSRQLAGDLSVIVEKALQRDSSNRYASADALLGDLERYQLGLPILARRPSVRYRVGKYLRRHRLAATLVGLILVALGMGYLSTIRQAQHTVREAQRATLVKDFLVSLFADVDPNVTGGTDLTATRLLERGASRVRRQLVDEPEVQVELFELIGSLYRDLGEYDSARPILAEAVQIRLAHYGPDDLRVAEGLSLEAGNELLASDLVAADSLLQRALAIEDAHGARAGPDRAEILGNLASLKRRTGDYEEAGRLYRETIRIDRAYYGSRHLAVASDLNSFAVFLDETGRTDSAEVVQRQALEIRQHELPHDHSDVAQSMLNLAEVLRRLSRPAEAESLYAEAIAIRRQIYHGAHPDLANSLRAWARLYEENGDLARADVLLREALTMSRELLGNEHSFVANCLNQVGILAYQRGDFEAARLNMHEALSIWEKSLPPEHATLWTVRGNLGAVEMLTGHAISAEDRYRKALPYHREALGPDHPIVAIDLNNLGVSLRLQGRFDESVGYHREALAILTEIRKSNHRDVIFGRYLIGVALTGARQFVEAEGHLREALTLAEQELPAGHRTTTDVCIGLGRLLVATTRAAEARTLLLATLEQWSSTNAQGNYRTGEIEATLGACLLALKRLNEAEPYLVRGHAVLLQILGPDSARTRRAADDLLRLQRITTP